MSNEIVFSYVKTGAEKKSIKKDDKGYYLITLGAFNAFNRSGAFYLMDGVRDLIENKSSSFNRRIRDGYLKGEAGHPVYESGMSSGEFIERNLRIEHARISHHIRDVFFKETQTPSGMSGKGNIVLAQAWIRPDGPFGDALKKSLDDPETNVAFSIRCFTQDTVVGGVTIKQVVQIITWDWVIEPGIKVANKFDTLNMESIDLVKFDLKDLTVPNNDLMISCESTEDKLLIGEMIDNANKAYKLKENNIFNEW